MPESVARVATARPERYVKQLVDHLGNRLSTRLTGDGTGATGRIDFDAGHCVLRAEDGVLVLAATADDPVALSHVRDVVARHLERFGSRDGLTVTWSDPG